MSTQIKKKKPLRKARKIFSGARRPKFLKMKWQINAGK